MKKTLLLSIFLLLTLSILSFPNQSSAEEPTTTPLIVEVTSEVLPETGIIQETREPSNEPIPVVTAQEAIFGMATYTPKTPEEKIIAETIENAFFILDEAAVTFDVSKFQTVFINDPRFPVSPEALETIRQLTLNPSLESAGLLDHVTAYRTWASNAILHYEAITARATLENRKLTEEERKSLSDPWGRSAPARVEGPIKILSIHYITMEVKDDIAVVTLFRGIYEVELTLVFVDKQWYIAKESLLAINP